MYSIYCKWASVSDGVSAAAESQHLRRNSKNISPPRVLYLLKQCLFYPSCLWWLHHLHNLLNQAACVCKVFWCFHSSTHSLARKTVILLWGGRQCFTVSQEVAGACIMSKMRNGLLRTSCCRKRQKNISVSFCTFPSLHTCIIQFNIFPFYGSKYSWMVKAQGELAQKLANLCKLASWYILAGVVFVTPLF